MARILVIEDNSAVRELVEIELSLEGHAVISMPDGPSGIASARQDPPDAVILDFRMPGMDGKQVLRALKELYPRLPVFFFTVYGDFPEKAGLGDADGCFVKSSDLRPVKEAIARIAGRDEARTGSG